MKKWFKITKRPFFSERGYLHARLQSDPPRHCAPHWAARLCYQRHPEDSCRRRGTYNDKAATHHTWGGGGAGSVCEETLRSSFSWVGVFLTVFIWNFYYRNGRNIFRREEEGGGGGRGGGKTTRKEQLKTLLQGSLCVIEEYITLFLGELLFSSLFWKSC